MTPEQAQRLLPIIEAYAQGMAIQFLTYDGLWVDAKNLVFDVHLTWRIKPVPREVYVLRAHLDSAGDNVVSAFSREHAAVNPLWGHWVRFVEAPE
jgi:hypothetical protein